MFHSKRTTY